MPEEFPSNEDITIGLDPGATGNGGGASGTPLLPGNNQNTGPDLVGEAAAPGTGSAGTSPTTPEPPSAGDGEEDPDGADAGADAAAPRANAPDSEGETAP